MLKCVYMAHHRLNSIAIIGVIKFVQCFLLFLLSSTVILFTHNNILSYNYLPGLNTNAEFMDPNDNAFRDYVSKLTDKADEGLRKIRLSGLKQEIK